MKPTARAYTSAALLRNIGPRLAHLRYRSGLSQAELSERAKVRQQSISKLEQCDYQPIPALDVLLSLARVFRIAPEQCCSTWCRRRKILKKKNYWKRGASRRLLSKPR